MPQTSGKRFVQSSCEEGQTWRIGLSAGGHSTRYWRAGLNAIAAPAVKTARTPERSPHPSIARWRDPNSNRWSCTLRDARDASEFWPRSPGARSTTRPRRVGDRSTGDGSRSAQASARRSRCCCGLRSGDRSSNSRQQRIAMEAPKSGATRTETQMMLAKRAEPASAAPRAEIALNSARMNRGEEAAPSRLAARLAENAPAAPPPVAGRAIEALPAGGPRANLAEAGSGARSMMLRPPLVIVSRDGSVSWMIGRAGTISRLSAGKTWQPQATGVFADLLAGSAPSASVCWAVGRSATIVRTIDGVHWQRIASPTASDLIAVSADSAFSATTHDC